MPLALVPSCPAQYLSCQFMGWQGWCWQSSVSPFTLPDCSDREKWRTWSRLLVLIVVPSSGQRE